MALSGWFQTDWFHFDSARPGPPDIFLLAYCATFRRLGELPASVHPEVERCILHVDYVVDGDDVSQRSSNESAGAKDLADR